MPPPLRKILIAEDDANQVDTWKRDVKEFNGGADRLVNFEILSAASASEASSILSKFNVDCAVLDIRLPQAPGEVEDATQGNVLSQFIETEHPILIAIHSGHPDEWKASERQSHIKVVKKDAGSTDQILQWFEDNSSLMDAFSSTSRTLRRESAKVLHRIWPSWNSNYPDSKKFEEIVTRQVVSHVAEQLRLLASDETKFHLREFYYIPPLRERLHTGDMVRLDATVYVIVTPQCDMARTYPSHILLARCDDEHDEWNTIKALVAQAGTVTDKTLEKIRKLTTNEKTQRHHFLPPCAEKGPWVANFGELITVSSEHASIEKLLAGRFASVAAYFVPNLISRFSSFIGRIGQPDLGEKSLADHLQRR